MNLGEIEATGNSVGKLEEILNSKAMTEEEKYKALEKLRDDEKKELNNMQFLVFCIKKELEAIEGILEWKRLLQKRGKGETDENHAARPANDH